MNFKHSWSFKLPITKNSSGYTYYLDKGHIFIFHSDGFKDITIIKSNGYNLTHESFKDTKLPVKYFNTKEFVRVGHQFWIPGGVKASFQNVFNNYFQAIQGVIEKFTLSTSLIWNLNKVRYHSGPTLPNVEWSRTGCFVTLNRTDVLVLYTTESEVDYDCFYRSTYSFASNQWNHYSNQCFSRLKIPDLFFNPYDNQQKGSFELRCSSSFDKESM